jgi:hypothetical protein
MSVLALVEEMHEADEPKQANNGTTTGDIDNIDNELKMWRWVVHQMAVDEEFVIRAADDFEWVDEMAYDRAKEVTIVEGEVDGIQVYISNHTTLRHYRLEKEMQLRRKHNEKSKRRRSRSP